ncbi:MAG: helix-turn-helix domain-containing protein [Candidatus Pacebacteria bacterium]|nr:helix-turn-helix domain-containing protein [Candidatus Paceibacterota bacterium]
MLTRFKTRKVNASMTVGECLKKRREDLGITLKQISEKLKIRESNLECLENNKYDKLPPDVYVKGFIKGYCEIVDCSFEKMLNLYNVERNIGDKLQKIKPKNKTKKTSLSGNYPILTPKIITLIFSIIVVFVVGYYLWYQISSFSSTPYLFVSNPLNDQIINNAEIKVSGQTEEDVIIRINGEDIFVDPTGYFSETIFLKFGNNILEIEAVNKFNKKSLEVRNIIYQKKLEYVPTSIEEETDISSGDLKDEDIEFIGP